MLDTAFREDDSRIRAGNAAANFSALRAFVLGLLKQRTDVKVGIKIKRRMAGWDDHGDAAHAKVVVHLNALLAIVSPKARAAIRRVGAFVRETVAMPRAEMISTAPGTANTLGASAANR